jgi:hypothetical protein
MVDVKGIYVSFENLSKEQQLDVLLALFEVAHLKLEKKENLEITYITKE